METEQSTLQTVREWLEWCKSHQQLATKNDLLQLEHKIMSAITDWAATEQADLTAIQTALAGIVSAIAGLNSQIATLTGQLASAGTLSASDAQALADLKTNSDALLAQAQAVLNPAPVTPPSP